MYISSCSLWELKFLHADDVGFPFYFYDFKAVTYHYVNFLRDLVQDKDGFKNVIPFFCKLRFSYVKRE